jgi:hypothetical protein
MEICKLRCHCGDTIEYQNPARGSYNVGHVVSETGWRCLFQPGGGILWLCPTCSRRAGMAAQVLIRLLGTGLVQLDHVGELE